MAVFPLVRLVEALPNLLELALADDADRKRDFQLVALADVAQIAVADERHAGRFQMIGDELPAQLILHGGDVGIEPIEIDIAADLELGADGIVFQIRGQKPHGRGNARIGRHDHLPKAEHGGHFDAVQRARAAERDQRKFARIDALLHRTRTDGIGHVAVDDGEHAFGRLELAHAERIGEFLDHAMGGVFIELHAAAEEIVLVEPAEHHIGVGDGRLFAAAPIRGRPRHRAGAARADPKGAALIDIGDRAAAGADGVNVDHRQQQREARNRGAARVGFGKTALDHDADVGAGAADVEGDELAASAQIADPSAAEDARGKP